MSAENTREYYRQQGVEAERERIIKLLQDPYTTWSKEEIEKFVKFIMEETE